MQQCEERVSPTEGTANAEALSQQCLACLGTSVEQPKWLKKSEKRETLELRDIGICHGVLEGARRT